MAARWSAILAGTCLAMIGASPASAGDVETRVFAVSVDGKPAGEFRLTIRTADDGTETALAVASVQVRFILGGYRYSYRGSEVWKAGRLHRFEAASEENGKKHAVRAVAAESSLQVTADGVTRTARPDLWPTSYWRMPDGAKVGQSLALLDADTGEEQPAKLDVVGATKTMVAGKMTDCTRLHVSGPTPADLWYDARGRLVGQETIEDGHKTVLTLREILR
jgi:hypothetical protein